MKQKGFVNAILMALVVVLLGALVYITFVKKSELVAVQQTPLPTKTTVPTPKDETADWKTYTNVTLGFEIKYPQSLSFVDVKEETPGQGITNVRFYVTTTSKKWGAGDGKYDPFVIAVQPKEFVINEYKSRGEIFDVKNALGEKDGKYYLFSRAQDEPEDWQGVRLPFEKIASSFKFTGQSLDSATVDWKTYTDTQYGFEFRYPATWKATANDSEGPSYKVIARIVNPARAGKPDTDVPVEQFLVRSQSRTCGGQPTSLGDKTGTDSGWSQGFGLIYYRDLCFGTQSWPVTITLSAFDASSEVVMDKILSTFKFTK